MKPDPQDRHWSFPLDGRRVLGAPHWEHGVFFFRFTVFIMFMFLVSVCAACPRRAPEGAERDGPERRKARLCGPGLVAGNGGVEVEACLALAKYQVGHAFSPG